MEVHGNYIPRWDGGWLLTSPYTMGGIAVETPVDNPPGFCTDANAVLPWLGKLPEFAVDYNGRRYLVHIHRHFAEGFPFGEAPTFARAAVLALLRAKRAEKGM
jgi:hypothetical protein